MGFKLGKETRQYRTPKDTPVFRKKLDKGILGEANNDGSIFVDKSLKPGSKKYNEVVNHEKDHIDRMKSGELGYGDDYVRWQGRTYPRKEGKIKYNNKWHSEGDKNLPWEKIANKNS